MVSLMARGSELCSISCQLKNIKIGPHALEFSAGLTMTKKTTLEPIKRAGWHFPLGKADLLCATAALPALLKEDSEHRGQICCSPAEIGGGRRSAKEGGNKKEENWTTLLHTSETIRRALESRRSGGESGAGGGNRDLHSAASSLQKPIALFIFSLLRGSAVSVCL
jgi:hypothetical protein